MVNDRMPEYCVERMGKILNRSRKALCGARVLVLGVAYKQDIDDYRESPALRVIEQLEKTGAQVDYFDPFISEYRYKGEKRRSIEKIDADIIASYDLVAVTAAHTTVDYEMVAKNAAAVFDTKNAMKNVRDRSRIELL